jgi:AcrR family transcriptional regulator
MDEEKRKAILDAAAKVFSSFGFRKASISDIARAAGVAKGTVYLACESKEDLFFQSVLIEVRRFIANVVQRLDPRLPADQLLEELSLRSLDFFDAHPLVRDLVVGIHHGDHPRWADKFESLRALGRKNIEDLLSQGIAQGTFRQDLNVGETAQILQDFQHAALIAQSRGMYTSGSQTKERVRAAVQLIVRGLAA